MEKVGWFMEAFSRAVKNRGGYALLVGGVPREMMRRRLRKPYLLRCRYPERMLEMVPEAMFRLSSADNVSILGSEAVAVDLPDVNFKAGYFKDLDFEVYGLQAEEVEETLGRFFGKVNAVGKAFGVFKMDADGVGVDVSLPRRESKFGKGHKGFMVTADPNMSPADAAWRRDYTVNSMAVDPLTWTLYDFHGGIRDLAEGVLRHVSPAFAEDSLRVLRGFQIGARTWKEMRVPEETVAMCRSLFWDYLTIVKERVWDEWAKWAAKSEKPSVGLRFLYQTGWSGLFPGLADLPATPQNPVWHPEGSALDHTLFVVDAAAEIAERENLSPEERMLLVLGALCHDFGKHWVTEFGDDGMIRSRGHAEVGEIVAIRFLESIGAPDHVIGAVSKLVRHHLAHLNGASPRLVRRLARLLEKGDEADGSVRDRYRGHRATIGLLVNLIEADHSGRPPLPGGLPLEAVALRDIAWAENIRNSAAPPLVMGRHLLENFEVVPGPLLGKVLASAYSAQEEGLFVEFDEALLWVEREHGLRRREFPVVFVRQEESEE